MARSRDIVARRPDGALLTHKLLSEKLDATSDAAHPRHPVNCSASRPARRCPPSASTPCSMGTTVATNALLERKGDRTVFVTTRGFADSLRIAYQHRPKLFVRRIELPSMLYEEVDRDRRTCRRARRGRARTRRRRAPKPRCAPHSRAASAPAPSC